MFFFYLILELDLHATFCGISDISRWRTYSRISVGGIRHRSPGRFRFNDSFARCSTVFKPIMEGVWGKRATAADNCGKLVENDVRKAIDKKNGNGDVFKTETMIAVFGGMRGVRSENDDGRIRDCARLKRTVYVSRTRDDDDDDGDVGTQHGYLPRTRLRRRIRSSSSTPSPPPPPL